MDISDKIKRSYLKSVDTQKSKFSTYFLFSTITTNPLILIFLPASGLILSHILLWTAPSCPTENNWESP